jgi:4-amino-4-deoxy-L-arabinose transferase-like glycosyltransferase
VAPRRTARAPNVPALVRWRPAILLSLIVVSAAIRIAYFRELDATPFMHLERWRQSDMHYYDDWARRIAAGDWRSASVAVPIHAWHHAVADAYRASARPPAAPGARPPEAPGVRSADRPEGQVSDEALWSHWMRTPAFYQDPLYPYLIAVIYRLCGDDVRYVVAAQMAIGVLMNVLIWSLTRRMFGDAVAVCAAVLTLLYAPFIFYESLLLRDSLVAVAGLMLVWVADRAVRNRSSRDFAMLGAALGLACLLKSTFAVAIAGVAIGLLVAAARRVPITRPALASACGLGIVLTPLIARNVAVGAPAVGLATSGPMTFVSANESTVRPEFGFNVNPSTLASFLGRTDGDWHAAYAAALGPQPAGEIARLVWRKWTAVWHWVEIPNNDTFYYFRLQLPVLEALPITWWACAPLALLGLTIGLRRWRQAWLLYSLVALSTTPLIVFYVLGRFRIALVAATLPFAALAIVDTWRFVRARRLLPGLCVCAGVFLAGAWTGRPLENGQTRIRTADWILAYSAFYQDKVYGALDAHDPRTAADWYLEFFQRYEPSIPLILETVDPTLAPELADMHHECAEILRAAGRPADADAQLAEARRLLTLVH